MAKLSLFSALKAADSCCQSGAVDRRDVICQSHFTVSLSIQVSEASDADDHGAQLNCYMQTT